MRKFAFGTLVCLVALAGGGVALAVDGSDAADAGNLALSIESSGVSLANRTSILNDATFGNFETPYDFFYQPWELPQIAFPQTWHLGNHHESGEGDYRGIFWSQVANTGRDFQGVDVWSSAYLTHAGPGYFGIALSFGSDEITDLGDTDSGTAGVQFGDIFSDSTDTSELYLTYGAAAGNIHWGVGLTIFGYDEESEDLVIPGTSNDKVEFSNYNLKGGVKFKGRDDLTWAVWASAGQPNWEETFTTSPSSSSEGRAELDGTQLALGADLNLYRGAYDLEFDGFFGTTDYDVTSTSGMPMVADITSSDLTDDTVFVRGRVGYPVGRAHVWHGVAISTRSVDSELADSMGTPTRGKWEFDNTMFVPSTGVKFPLGCKDCATKWNLLAGARWEQQNLNIEERSFDNGVLVSGGGIDDTFGNSEYRLGLEVRGERYVFELLWDSDSGGTCSAQSPFPGNGDGQDCRNSVDNQELTGAFSIRY